MRLALVLHTGPDSLNTGTVINLARAARERGDEVTVFIMTAGVLNLAREDFTSLIQGGTQITVCEHNRGQFKAPEGVAGVNYGSQYDLAGYTHDFDRVVSFS
ncbi:MAG: DsrE family protein [Nitrospinae bacterium]|nr:DsrE family protein [Nitrospinota bacterium]